MRPQPWHAKAREMHASGATVPAIASACSVSDTTVKKLLVPAYRAAQLRSTAVRRQERYDTDPKFRAHVLATAKAGKKLYRMRKDAKCEAYDTGQKYEDVCRAWDIAP